MKEESNRKIVLKNKDLFAIYYDIETSACFEWAFKNDSFSIAEVVRNQRRLLSSNGELIPVNFSSIQQYRLYVCSRLDSKGAQENLRALLGDPSSLDCSRGYYQFRYDFQSRQNLRTLQQTFVNLSKHRCL